ncbi:hypothetical protein ACLOJK_003809 [Asimina triloba]
MGLLETLLQILQIIPLVWEQFGYVKDLNSNVATLMRETRELKRKRREFKEEVDDAESVGEKRLCSVDVWFNQANKVVPEVYSIKEEFDQGTLNPLRQHKLGKRVLEKLKDVKKLNDRGVFDQVSKSPRQPLMQKMQDPGQIEQESSCMETLEDRGQVSTNWKSGMFCVCGRPRQLISKHRGLQFKQNGGARRRAYKSVSTMPTSRPAANEGSSVEGICPTITFSEPLLRVDLQAPKQAVEQVCSNVSTSSSLPTTPGTSAS